MRRPSRFLVAVVAVPFMVGCTATLAQPLPEPAARPAQEIRGVVLTDGERVEYSGTENVEWREETVEITGALKGQGGNLSTRTFQIDEIESILIHQVDVNRTSLIVATIMFGLGVLGAIAFQGATNETTVFEGM